jgi:hypothetical protein
MANRKKRTLNELKEKVIKKGESYIEGNTKYVPIQVKGKTQYMAFAHYPMDEKQISSLEAVKQGVFTMHEMLGVLECFRDNLSLLFHVLDRPGANSEELVERICSFKNHYLVRWDKLSPVEKPQYHHQYQKLMDYLDGRLWQEQKKVFLSLRDSDKMDLLIPPPTSEYKPLLLKEMAEIYGCSVKHLSKLIKEQTKEYKFIKKSKGRYYLPPDLILLEKLLNCPFSENNRK